MRLRAPRRTGDVAVFLGDSTSGLIRLGSTDWVFVRLYTLTGEVFLAFLPRAAVSSSTTLLDDLFLPVIGTPLIATPMGNAGPAAGAILIDLSSLPAA